MKNLPLILFTGLVIFASCTTQRGGYTNYLKNPGDSSGRRITLPAPVIHRADLISIKIYSQSTDPRTDAPYNLPEQTVAGSTASATAGFLVNDSGDIEYPQIGRLHVEGLTKGQLAEIIRKRFENDLKNPSVIVRFLNYSITILGEVRSPGRFVLPTEHITIFEALGLSGDVTDYGNKKAVKVAREKDGAYEIGFIDLSSEASFASPYFRLQQNDVIFVEQIKRKTEQIEQGVFAQRLGLISAVISTFAIVYSLIRR